MIPFKDLIQTLDQERRRQGLPIVVVAGRMGMTAPRIGEVLSGKEPNPHMKTVLRLIEALEVDVTFKVGK